MLVTLCLDKRIYTKDEVDDLRALRIVQKRSFPYPFHVFEEDKYAVPSDYLTEEIYKGFSPWTDVKRIKVIKRKGKADRFKILLKATRLPDGTSITHKTSAALFIITRFVSNDTLSTTSAVVYIK